MEDKTPVYLLTMVGIVALVAVAYILTGTAGTANVGAAATGNSLTGNVVADDITPIDWSGIGRVFFGVVLVGTCAYMYMKNN